MTTRLAVWIAETRADLKAERENRAEQEARAAALHQRATTAALARHPELSAVDFAMDSGGVDHLSVLAGAFTDADREDRAQRRQRAEVLAERRLTSPMPVGRTHQQVLADYAAWADWTEAGMLP
jgi:hypothetical protein